MKKTIFLILSGLIAMGFVGCSSKEQINPTPKEIERESIEDEAKEELYTDKGYAQGRKDGFLEGLTWAEKSSDKLLKKLNAVLFSSYLIRDKYILPGPIYISEEGQIILGSMEIQEPYTKADIYNRYGAELPRFDNDDFPKKKKGSENTITQDKLIKSFLPTVHKKPAKPKKITNKTIQKSDVEVEGNKTNQDILNRLGISGGAIDGKYVIPFETKNDAVVFCTNFDICLNMEVN